jgi:hypothetical protein
MSSNDDLNDPNAPIPWVQQLLDSPFILLFLGVLIPCWSTTCGAWSKS